MRNRIVDVFSLNIPRHKCFTNNEQFTSIKLILIIFSQQKNYCMNTSKYFFHLSFFLFFSLSMQAVSARPDMLSASYRNPGDTTINDLSNRFKVTIPTLQVNLSAFIDKINVAVIPLNSLGKVDIPWDDNQKQVTKETEKEFETNLLKCINGKDSGSDAGVIIKKKKSYCERTGYGDAAMGHYSELCYAGFTKENKLIIVELHTRWSTCMNLAGKSRRKKCEADQALARQRIELMFENLVRKIKVMKK